MAKSIAQQVVEDYKKKKTADQAATIAPVLSEAAGVDVPEEALSAKNVEAVVKQEPKGTTKDKNNQQLLFAAIGAALPTLIGAAFGGAEGGAIGAQAGSQFAGNIGSAIADKKRSEEEKAAKLEASQMDFAQKKELKDADLAFKAEQAEKDREFKKMFLDQKAAAAQGATGQKLTKGQEAVDKAFAKTYEDYVAQGGSEGFTKKLNQLRDVADKLGKSDSITGPVVGSVPKGLRDIIAPTSAAVQDTVEQVIQESLRQTLGAQFTEKEASRLIERAYNPKLSEAENAKRLQGVIAELEGRQAAIENAAGAFEERGTLQGFKGSKGKAGASRFPLTVKSADGKSAVVSNESELEEAMSEGFAP